MSIFSLSLSEYRAFCTLRENISVLENSSMKVSDSLLSLYSRNHLVLFVTTKRRPTINVNVIIHIHIIL